MEHGPLFISAERARSQSASSRLRAKESAAQFPSVTRDLTLRKKALDLTTDLRDPEFWGLCLLGVLLLLFA